MHREVLDAVRESIKSGSKGAASVSDILNGYVETRWASTHAVPRTARAEQVQLID